MRHSRLRSWTAVGLCLVAMLAADTASAQATGTVAGTVVGPEGAPLPGAKIEVVGTRLEATSDRLGRFRIAPVPVGGQQIRVSFIGFEDQQLPVVVQPDSRVIQDFTLQLAAFTGTVTVSDSPILQGQALALAEQQNANQIVNVVSSEQIETFPDTNAAEVAQRVPAVFIQRDQGEGRYVLIRGTAASLNRTQIDGEVMPAPEGDVRQVALDVVPSDLLESMVVSKALTPDQDADAIGGIVNLEFKDAPAETMLNANLGGYYGDLRDGDGVQAGFSYGNRFSSDTVGLLLAASYTDITRNSENFEADSWEDGQPLEFETRDYNVNRERLGFVGALDFRVGDSGSYRIKGIYNEFADQEYRRRTIYTLEDNEMERELKDRYEEQQIWNLYFEGENAFGSSALTYKLSYAHAEEAEPKANYPVFVQEDVEFDPFFDGPWFEPNPLNQDLGAFLFKEIETNDNFTEEDTLVARADYQQAFATGYWKAGVKYRGNEKSRDNEIFVYESEDDLFLPAYIDDWYSGSIVQDQYISGSHPGPGSVGEILGLPGIEGEKVLEEDLADYDATEDVYSAYGMAEIYLSDDVMLLPGLRYEYSDVSYDAFEFDEEEETLTPVSGTKTYGDVLPNLHLRWTINDRSNLRAAITRTLARPNFESVVPTTLIIREDNEIERGNADLDPTNSWNLDLMYEHFFRTVGVVSAGVFYKSIEDFVFISSFDEERDGDTWEVTQPVNGDDATLWGVELAFQNQFRNWPSPFDGFGFYVNYTWTDSDATIPGRENRDAPLPGQPEQVANIAISYEKGFFSGILSWNYQGEWLEEVVAEVQQDDEWVDEHEQLDFQAQFRITDQFTIYAQVYNLTDEPYRRYYGQPGQPLQEEYYSWWGLLGLKFRL
jgi:TonB-dependent receptor